jgi:hypothetical protein
VPVEIYSNIAECCDVPYTNAKITKFTGFQDYSRIGRQQGKGDDERWVRIIPGISYCNEPIGSVVELDLV